MTAPTNTVDLDDVVKRLKHQTSEARALLVSHMQVANDLLDLWLKDPKGDRLPPTKLEQMVSFLLGCKVQLVDGHMVRVGSPHLLKSNVKPPLSTGSGKSFGRDGGQEKRGPMKVTEPTVKGSQVEMNRESIARQKKAEEQEAARKKQPPVPLRRILAPVVRSSTE